MTSNAATSSNGSFVLPPIKKERITEILVPTVHEELHEICHTHDIERFEEIPKPRIITRTVPTPKFHITERELRIPKPVIEQKIVEIPHVQVVEKVVEVPQYVYKEKIIEKPKIIIQERIIPIPKRTIEEKIVEIPEDSFNEVMGSMLKQEGSDVSRDCYPRSNGLPQGKSEQPTVSRDYLSHRHQESYPAFHENNPPSPVSSYPSNAYAPPHFPQRIVHPAYTHTPTYYDVPMPHYREVPVERYVYEPEPVPVEAEVEQEVKVPKINHKFIEVPIDVPVNCPYQDQVPPYQVPYCYPPPVSYHCSTPHHYHYPISYPMASVPYYTYPARRRSKKCCFG